MSENIPNLMKDTNLQVQENDQIPNKVNPKKSTSKCTYEN